MAVVSDLRFSSMHLTLVAIMVSSVSSQAVPAVPAFTADLQGAITVHATDLLVDPEDGSTTSLSFIGLSTAANSTATLLSTTVENMAEGDYSVVQALSASELMLSSAIANNTLGDAALSAALSSTIIATIANATQLSTSIYTALDANTASDRALSAAVSANATMLSAISMSMIANGVSDAEVSAYAQSTRALLSTSVVTLMTADQNISTYASDAVTSLSSRIDSNLQLANRISNAAMATAGTLSTLRLTNTQMDSAVSSAILALQLTDQNLSTAVSQGFSQATVQMQIADIALGSRVDGILQALEANRLERESLNRTIQTLIGSAATLGNRISDLSDIVGDLIASVEMAHGGALIRTCRLSLLSGWNATGLIPDILSVLNSGTAVPSGGDVTWLASSGYFANTSARATCTNGTWNGTVPVPGMCLANCTTCTDTTDCSACAPGTTLNISEAYMPVVLNSSAVSLATIGLTVNSHSGDAITAAELASAKNSLVNGAPNAANYVNLPGYENRTCANPAWISIDLGEQMRIGSVTVWHYWLDSRRYCGQRIAISTTGLFTGEEVQLHSTGLSYGEVETSAGLTVPANGSVARYVRHWSGGSTSNTVVHFIGIQIRAVNLSSAVNLTLCQ